MLNELYHLSGVLEGASIIPYEWHKDLKALPNASNKKPCYRIEIDSNRSIASIEPMNLDAVASLRKWERNNGDSFPGFNIQPLYRITDEVSKKSLKRWREGKGEVDLNLLKEWCSQAHTRNWDAIFSKKIKKCLGAIPQALEKLCIDIPKDFDALKILCERTVKLSEDGIDAFFQAIDSYIWRSLKRGEHVQSLLPILIYEGSANKKAEEDRGSISVFMDVPDWTEFPVAHENTIKAINECLLAHQRSGLEGKIAARDAFGQSAEGHEEKLPEVKLPVLGGVKLRAMFSEIPCQYRYKTIDSASYRIGAESRKRTKGALEWLKDESREGQTWGRVDGKEVLFAYPTTIPKVPIKLASCFGARKRDDTETRFARYAQDIVTCLEGVSPSLKDVEIRVFSLRKMDKARTKVVFHRNYSAQRLADAAVEWQQGCANIPLIKIKTRDKQKGTTTVVGPETPFPLEVSECLNHIWRLNGTPGEEVKATPKSSGIELLLDELAPQRQVPYLLALAVQNGKGLFLSLGNTLHRNDPVDLRGLNKHKYLMPAILGLLIWKLGVGKEMYMKNPSYLIGRMLKLADELHAVYCKEVRGGNLPPQLLGNALMAGALDSPTQALSQLALRIAPYLGWARTNSSPSAGLSRYLLKEFGLIEAGLRDATLPSRLADIERAELLLGYISTGSQTVASNSTNNYQEGENHE